MLIYLSHWETRRSIPVLHSLIRMKLTNVFLQVAKKVEVTREKIWAVRIMLKRFPAKFLKLIPHQIGSMGTGIIILSCKKMISFDRIPGSFWLWRAPALSAAKNEQQLSALLCLPPSPILAEHTLHYAHLQRNKEISVVESTTMLSLVVGEYAVSLYTMVSQIP